MSVALASVTDRVIVEHKVEGVPWSHERAAVVLWDPSSRYGWVTELHTDGEVCQRWEHATEAAALRDALRMAGWYR